MKYKIDYFKSSGKWYSEAEFEIDNPKHMCVVADYLTALETAPGFSTKAREFYWVINPLEDDDISYPIMLKDWMV